MIPSRIYLKAFCPALIVVWLGRLSPSYLTCHYKKWKCIWIFILPCELTIHFSPAPTLKACRLFSEIPVTWNFTMIALRVDLFSATVLWTWAFSWGMEIKNIYITSQTPPHPIFFALSLDHFYYSGIENSGPLLKYLWFYCSYFCILHKKGPSCSQPVWWAHQGRNDWSLGSILLGCFGNY